MRRDTGFTLLELVLVLSILSVATLLLTQSFSGYQHEQRVRRSNALLAELLAAISGAPPVAANGTEQPFFVGDLGRLPRAVTNGNDRAQLTLGELVERPEFAPEYGVFSAKTNLCARARADGLSPLPMDNGVMVPMGWRGPYLKLLPGAESPWVRDGWGNAMVSKNAAEGRLDFSAGELPNRLLGADWAYGDGVAEQSATNGMPVCFIRHLGADGLSELTEGPADSYDRDVSVAPVSNAFVRAVSGYIRLPTNAPAWAVVRVYGPNPDPVSEADSSRVMAWEWREKFTETGGRSVPFVLTNRTARMTAGQRMIRVCTYDGGGVTNYGNPIPVRLLPGTSVLNETLTAESSQP